MSHSNTRVGIYTLGCKVNQYESEAIAELFLKQGFQICPPNGLCDIYIINTCTVTAESDRKARQFIRRAIKQNPNAYILVTGCLAQTQPQQVAKIEGVDYICGNSNKSSVVDAALDLLKSGKKVQASGKQMTAPDANGFEPMQISHFNRTRAYVKIEDGCESKCTYCIIPQARGKIRSKAPQDVLEEVRSLTAGGCREIVLTGIETASYGKDLDGYTLADLLCEIDGLKDVGRIRLGSLDPSLIKQSFVDRIAPLKSLAPHFHLSMQSGSDSVLQRMKRKYNIRMALEGMERLRRALPNVQFTTDMIVGFPGESEAEFSETLAFIREAKFLSIHVFPYSRRKGTEADRMPEQIAEEIKHLRVAILSEEEARIRSRILDAQIGKRETVLFETYKDGMAYGHTPNFIEVACPSPCSLHAKIQSVELKQHDGNICYGQMISAEL